MMLHSAVYDKRTCSRCGKLVEAAFIGKGGRCPDCLQKEDYHRRRRR